MMMGENTDLYHFLQRKKGRRFRVKIPRILLAAGASGRSGKTLITCGLLQALVNRGKMKGGFF